MPGPVEIPEPVRAAFERPPISHRCQEFVDKFEAVREGLRTLTGARHVALFQGSGTLANDVIASSLQGLGLILVNGEFGQRLTRHAEAWNLRARVVESAWGTPWDLDRARKSMSGVRWVWGVHLETSTGMVNDLAPLARLTEEHGVRLCLDCISSLGAVPLDLNADLKNVWLASGVSGKALGSYTGIAMVFCNELPAPRPVPVYLDLEQAIQSTGSQFTFSSPLIAALAAALELPRADERLGQLVRQHLEERSIRPLVDGPRAAPTVTTFAEPSAGFLERCRGLGYLLGGESGYLRNRGLVQIATMGAVAARQIDELFRGLG